MFFIAYLNFFKKITITLLTSYVVYIIYVGKHIKGGERMGNMFLRDFDPDVYRAAKIRAAEEGITLKEVVRRALIEYTKKPLKKKGG